MLLTLESCSITLKFHQKGVDNTPRGCIIYAKVNQRVKS
nr:MAG TPA: hypothetical protein [Caudoviricetes sp.]